MLTLSLYCLIGHSIVIGRRWDTQATSAPRR